MSVIWKTQLQLTDVQEIEVPLGAEMLCARTARRNLRLVSMRSFGTEGSAPDSDRRNRKSSPFLRRSLSRHGQPAGRRAYVPRVRARAMIREVNTYDLSDPLVRSILDRAASDEGLHPSSADLWDWPAARLVQLLLDDGLLENGLVFRISEKGRAAIGSEVAP
jgi:hypothetical protein